MTLNTAVDFLGIGAQKAGTTWLAVNLRLHPDLYVPPVKEVHFWDRHYDRGPDWYRKQFATAKPHQHKGEITPAYAILADSAIGAVAKTCGGARLFYILRNPVDRSWSSALKALERAEMMPDEASDQWFIDHFRSSGSRRRSDYATCLRNWLRWFPADQLRVELYDSIATEPRALLARIAAHIGVAPDRASGWQEAGIHDRVLPGSGYPLRPRLREILLEMHAPAIQDLAGLLGLDLSSWERPPIAPPPRSSRATGSARGTGM